MAQLVIFLEPLGHFKAGDFRHLDVHPDQVGLLLAGDVQRSLPALARVGDEERAELTMVIGAVVAIGLGVYTYRRPDVHDWTDEVASELAKVTWPDKNEVTNSTIIVIVTSAFATIYLALLDRFWGFVTNLVYGS